MTSSGEGSPTVTPTGTPINTAAPKYGTVIPNRIFVGGIAANTNEQELKQFFTAYGAVKDSKIISDRAGVSKGYGFITFETQDDAEKIIKKEVADNLIFKERKLNIGPAIRKQLSTDPSMQAYPRIYDAGMTPGTILFTNGVPYTYQNGMAFFHPPEGTVPAQPQAPYTVMIPPTAPHMYVSQPYAYQTPGGTVDPVTAGGYAYDISHRQESLTTLKPVQATAPPAWSQTSPYRWPAQGHTQIPTASGTAYLYPASVQPQEVYSTPQTYPPDIAEASMMEAAPAEGSMYSIPAPQPKYAEAEELATTTISTVQTSTCHKRPLPSSTPQSIHGIVHYSPSARATPPTKIMATGSYPHHRAVMIPSRVNGTAINIVPKEYSASQRKVESSDILTSPDTPQEVH